MFINRLALRLRKYEATDHKSTVAALDYIRRKNIAGATLRATDGGRE
jgi:hypothetical protein